MKLLKKCPVDVSPDQLCHPETPEDISDEKVADDGGFFGAIIGMDDLFGIH